MIQVKIRMGNLNAISKSPYRFSPIIPFIVLVFISNPLLSQQCPTAWDDAGVSIADPNPPPPTGTPALTIDGIKRFVDENNIESLEGLLSVMPPAMRKNYALVETSRTSNLSSVNHPRIIMFGSDARFLMALGSHPDDPKREQVDIAQLDDETGFWLFRSLDFGNTPPKLSADDSACVGCHSSPPRPFWGSYPDWPGMFGPINDRLTSSQSATLNRLRETQGGSDRFFHLVFLDSFYNQAGRPVSLPGRVYPYTNTIFNMELGAAVADGAYIRLRANKNYRSLREEMLVVGYCQREINDRRAVLAKVRDTLDGLGAVVSNSANVKIDLYRFLGVDPDNAFSLDKLAHEPPDPGWNVSTDSLFALVEMLVLNELMEENDDIREILENAPDRQNGFSRGCFDSIAESLRYKIYQGWTLRNEARQAAREVDFDVDLLRSGQGIFRQVGRSLCDDLVDTVMNRDEVPSDDNDPDEPPVDNTPDDDNPGDSPNDDEPTPGDDTPTAICPDGARFTTDSQNRKYCWFENLPVSSAEQSYCYYFNSHRTLGYFFKDQVGGSCRKEARRASNQQGTTFCLYENIAVPAGATQDCDGLISQRRIGFSFP